MTFSRPNFHVFFRHFLRFSRVSEEGIACSEGSQFRPLFQDVDNDLIAHGEKISWPKIYLKKCFITLTIMIQLYLDSVNGSISVKSRAPANIWWSPDLGWTMGVPQFSFIPRCGIVNLRTFAGGIWDKFLIISGSRLLIKILITTWDINHPFSHGFEVLRGIGIMPTGDPRLYQCWAENRFITLMNTIWWYIRRTNIPIDDEIIAH
jgi:hypothetical protein